ncbi:hypothetical protein KY326_02860, partial [Candidatus Woesearchaeota archaeon]|nr:hypothetical protein [Candidatus Woesearchaeota archaeon]
MVKKRLMIGIGIIIIIALIFLIPYIFPTSLKITKTQADPIKIAPGKYLTIFAEIQNKEEIESVYVEIPFEGGVDKIEMEKVASKFNKDIYQAKWLCHATAHARWYQANITAIDILGNKVFSTVDFQDPTVNHTWPQLAGGNGCLISTTLSSCPNGYSADTR